MTVASIRVADDGVARCAWVGADPVYAAYHDDEWGVELRGDRPLFEKLTLEAFQSGLSWITILRRRDGFRRAFHAFDWARIAAYDDGDVTRLMSDEGIIRNRAKITATLANARVLTEWLSVDPGGLDALIWSHQPAPRRERLAALADVPAQTAESRALASALKQRGLRFVGPTTAYALMQSAGLVDDHVVGCWRAR
ncbi:MAG: DNA-3-methyladenine glycosylase I [Microcella sp.]|uniref:DNA-3-methyladenine glycosylase I n=1 Tax=Microcella sp. TaxID=1913979 RepID=UPI0024CB1DF2|nr:DNA-3-methyladenine glycosylase I [Microcella sp.]UYN83957.1 MAG: DNA-3-methyladenine glycosylase I [Microcella sp.]